VDLLVLDGTPALHLEQATIEVDVLALGGGDSAVLELSEEQPYAVTALAELPPRMMVHIPDSTIRSGHGGCA
jgi:hypothetical protein